VILKVTEHHEAGVPTLQEIEPQVQEAMYMQAMQPALREYLTKLREEAYIDIKPGFVDSGASPRQTKPVFSAYVPPAPKKKKAQEKERFDRHGRFSTVSKTSSTPVTPTPAVASSAGTVAAASATTPTSPATTNKTAVTPSKPKKVKREKVRYGQAPRNALPPGPQTASEGVGAGAASATAYDAGSAVAPGAAMAPTESTTQISATSDPDPLAPKQVATGKTRYSYRAKTEAAEKAAKKTAKQKEKLAATPAAPTGDELATEKQQANPLGLNGDTATKKKHKKDKNAPKERLQNKDTKPAPEAPAPDPTVNPSLGATPAGLSPTAPARSAPTPNPPTPAPQN
jgi:peptidyl-prolyl cis-trans isomerase SurA